jgi:hypothetical protein
MRRASAIVPLRALITALALAGCAEGAPPPAAAPAPTPPPAGAWQQFCEQAYSVPHASALAAARGNEGWELVAMYNGVLCYKRPAAGATAPRPPQTAPSAPPPARDFGF